MKYNKVLLLIVLVFSVIFAACSDDDSNPTDTTIPEGVGVYTGTNSMDTTMSITISNINGKAYLTGYSVNYKNSQGTIKGSYAQTDSEGLAIVTNNAFSYSLGSESDEVLVGAISGNTMTGTFKFPPQFSDAIIGTFSITKQ